MLKIKTKFRLVIVAHMFTPLTGMMLFAHDTPMYDTPEFQGALGVGVAATILMAFCSPFLLSLKWLLLSQLAQISSAISRIKAGNYTYFSLPNEPSETGDENEVVSLMRDMNWMIRQIEFRETELEDRVHMRTRELEKTNAELIRARDAANASARAKSQFLATMSHELRTPMNAVIGMSDLALKANQDPGQQEYLSVINAASKSLLKIINDILDFSKMDAGKLILETIPVSLRDLLDEAADLFRGQVRESTVEFILDIAADVPKTVTGDPLRLRQVVVNLLSNAFKFTEHGEICLCVRPEPQAPDHIHFSIRDTGLGMDEETRKGLFHAFTQADGSTTRKYGGTGLGLAISRKLVRLMGSDISVESTPGRGSCFTFVLELPSCGPAQRPQAPLPATMSGKRIIVAVPHRTTRKVLMNFLRDFGLTPREVDPSGDLSYSQDGAEDEGGILALVDADRTDTDPERLAARIKSARNLPVIAVGSPRPATQGTTPQWADRFLLKPVKQSLLFDCIMDLCLSPGFLSTSDGLPERLSHGEAPKVLLVEDNRMNQKVALEILKTVGIRPVLASLGEEALSHLAATDVDAVLMDIQMPDMDGYQVTRDIRARGHKTKIIGMSANAMAEDRRNGMEAGMDAYITKPVDADILFQTLEKCLGKPVRPLPANRILGEDDPGSTLLFHTTQPGINLPGIDLPAALERLRGNKSLLTELILEFTREHAGLMETLGSLIRDGERDKLLDLLHPLKANAGNIGAQELAAALGDQESLVREIKIPEPQALAPALGRVSRALAQVMEAGKMLESREKLAPPPRGGGAINPRLPEMMAELKTLLDQHSLGAKAFSKKIADTLTGTPWQQDALLLRAQTGRFDFTTARKTFERLRAAIPNGQPIING